MLPDSFTDAAAEFAAMLEGDQEQTLRDLAGESGRVVLNADDLFMRYPPYRDGPAKRMILGPMLYPIARRFTDWAFSRMLKDPAVGRVVPIPELARTHHGSQVAVLLLQQRYAEEPQVDVRFWKLVEGGPLASLSWPALRRRIHPALDELCRQAHDLLDVIRKGEDTQWEGQPVSGELADAAHGR